jgi:hypothetical protein
MTLKKYMCDAFKNFTMDFPELFLFVFIINMVFEDSTSYLSSVSAFYGLLPEEMDETKII